MIKLILEENKIFAEGDMIILKTKRKSMIVGLNRKDIPKNESPERLNINLSNLLVKKIKYGGNFYNEIAKVIKEGLYERS